MRALKRTAALGLALLLPPAAVWLMRGPRRGFFLNAVLYAGGQAVFWTLAALPGLLLVVLAMLQALVLALMPEKR